MRLPVNSLALKCGWYPTNYHATLGSANIVVAWRWKVREEIVYDSKRGLCTRR